MAHLALTSEFSNPPLRLSIGVGWNTIGYNLLQNYLFSYKYQIIHTYIHFSPQFLCR